MTKTHFKLEDLDMNEKKQMERACFVIPKTLFERVKEVSNMEDLNYSILFRRMVREWLERNYSTKQTKISQ
jgi:hypothetical protein